MKMNERLKKLKADLKLEKGVLSEVAKNKAANERLFKAEPTADNGKMFTAACTAWKNQFLKVSKLSAAVESATN